MKLCSSFEKTTPGPGAYDSSTSFETHGAITMKSPRFTPRKALSPGPGRYTATLSASKGSAFPKSQRSPLFASEKSPGPGRYNIPHLSPGPSFRLRGKKSQKVPLSPGPGTYSPRFIIKKSSTVTIGKAKRNEIIVVLDTPGPGMYENSVKCSSPRWSIHGVNDKSFNSTPGPGRYEVLSPKQTQVSTPRALRQALFKSTESPGPGAYESLAKVQGVKFSIGKAKRPGVKSITPGPGRYEPRSLNSSYSQTFSTEAKKTLEFKSEAPAANTYSPQAIGKAPAYSFSKKLNKAQSEVGPGPGAYSVEKKNSRAPVAKFSKSMRFIKTFTQKEIEDRPGPAEYDVKTGLFKGNFFIAKAK